MQSRAVPISALGVDGRTAEGYGSCSHHLHLIAWRENSPWMTAAGTVENDGIQLPGDRILQRHEGQLHPVLMKSCLRNSGRSAGLVAQGSAFLQTRTGGSAEERREKMGLLQMGPAGHASQFLAVSHQGRGAAPPQRIFFLRRAPFCTEYRNPWQNISLDYTTTVTTACLHQ